MMGEPAAAGHGLEFETHEQLQRRKRDDARTHSGGPGRGQSRQPAPADRHLDA
jgi:hypothetical protein